MWPKSMLRCCWLLRDYKFPHNHCDSAYSSLIRLIALGLFTMSKIRSTSVRPDNVYYTDLVHAILAHQDGSSSWSQFSWIQHIPKQVAIGSKLIVLKDWVCGYNLPRLSCSDRCISLTGRRFITAKQSLHQRNCVLRLLLWKLLLKRLSTHE